MASNNREMEVEELGCIVGGSGAIECQVTHDQYMQWRSVDFTSVTSDTSDNDGSKNYTLPTPQPRNVGGKHR
jgi:hypothetical protein